MEETFKVYVAGVLKEFKQKKTGILADAKKMDPNIHDVRLGGSYGRGTPKPESDIDLEFAYEGNPPGELFVKLAGRYELGGGLTDAGVVNQPRVPAGNPKGGRWTK